MVKEDVFIVFGFMASLKVALRTWPMGTLAAPFAGSVAVTTGATGGGVPVVNVHT
jgi:hypothetical protein